MLEKSFGLFYYLKQAQNLKNEKRYVYLRITVNGDCRELSLKRQWMPNQWNARSGRAIGDNDETKELNTYLDLTLVKIYQAKIKLLETNKPVTAAGIKDVLLGNDEKKNFIMEAFALHNKQLKALVGVDTSSATLTRYKTAYDHVNNFIRWKYGKQDLEIKYLDYEFISQFVFWLKTERNCCNNTAIKY